MPLSNIDWAKNPRDPHDFLTVWSETVAAALIASLPTDRFAVETGTAARFAVETEAVTRACVTKAIASVTPAPDVPTFVAPARFTDHVSVLVSDTLAKGAEAVVLFVTLDNKSDSDASLAFAVRAAAFVTGGVGVVIVDAVPGPPSWATHLHSLVGVCPLPRRPRSGEASVLVVRPRVSAGAEQYAVWYHSVPAGAPLPTVHVPVGGENLKLDLEATYRVAHERPQ
jgi:hypothetical protein